MKKAAKKSLAIIVVLAVIAGIGWGGFCFWRSRQINVLFITLDTTRADRLGCYGYEKATTPALDQLAKRGVLFNRAFCNIPLTLPAHTTMMTGLQPPEHGCRVNGMTRLGDKYPTVAESFKKRGYETGAFVAAFVLDHRFGLNRGFDRYDDFVIPEPKDGYDPGRMYKYRRGDVVAGEALSWLEKHYRKPFFCWVHFYDPHHPYYYKRDPYNKEIRFMDRQVGRLLQFLVEKGVRKKTMVVVVGDHGEALGEHGEDEHGLLLYNGAMRVPLIVSLPDRIPEGEQSDALVTHVDLFATLTDYLGWALPDRTSGRSFASLLLPEDERETKWKDRPAYMETQFPLTEYGWSPLYGVLYEDWKYILAPKEELYDQATDPGETNNLAAAEADRVDDLQAELEALRKAMVMASEKKIKLDEAAQEALESLGYVGGGGETTEKEEGLLDPKDVIHLRVNFIKSLGLERMGQFDKAEALLRDMIKESPKSFAFQNKLATMLYRQEKWKEACVEYEAVAKKYPDRYKTHYTFGTALIRIGKFEQAVDELRVALKIAPRQLPCYNNLGIALLKSGEIFEAIEVFKESLELKNDQKDPHNNLGSAYLQQRKIDEAEKEFREAIKIDADFVDAHYNLGLVLLGKKKLKEAVTEFRTVLQLQPNHMGARQRLRMALGGPAQRQPPPAPPSEPGPYRQPGT